MEASMIGKSLSHYQILEKLGSGGMGEVYVAEDTKLSRKIALKALPPEMAENPERRIRFERETKAVAALNHPNIVTIHSVEEVEGVHFYTMEYVKGKTLSELIPKAGLALAKFFDVAIPLSDAVSTAHEHGITHRDLKPDNIMVTEEGRLKILDFGLAKLKQEFLEAGASELPTQPATQEGRILGTVAYMSPEQAEGKTIDHRSDIFSLGIILFEMATGRRPFEGDTTASILSSIIKDTPDSVTDVNPALPRDLGKIIRRCLVKDPEHRYQTAKDSRNELEELKQEVDSGEFEQGARVTVKPVTRKKMWFLAAAALVGVVTIIFYLLIQGVVEEPPAGPTVASFSRLTTDPGQELHPSLSPDGKFVAYQRRIDGQWDIFLLRVGGHNPANLTKDSPADDIHPAFSPDGESIAFRSEREGGGIFVMGATGESVRRVLDFGYDPAWSPDGEKIAVATTDGVPGDRAGQSELWVVDLNNGTKTKLATANKIQPQWSPHGKRIAYYDAPAIWTIPAEGGTGLRLSEGEAREGDGLWSPDGNYIYYSSIRGGSSNLWRVPVDEETGERLGPPQPVTSGAGGLRERISIGQNGRQIAYVERSVRRDLYKLDFDHESETIGTLIPLVEGRNAVWPDVSPDGQWVVFFEGGMQQQEDIAIVRSDGTGYRQLTNDLFVDRHPRWSPDGQRIAFGSRRDTWDIWVVNRDGSGLELLAGGEEDDLCPVWSPDGTFVAYLGGDRQTLQSVTSSRSFAPSLPMLAEEDAMFVPWDWSQDGTRLAGWRRIKSTGRDAGILVYSFESESYESLTDFGRNPVWLSDGRRILFSDVEASDIFLVDSKTSRTKNLTTGEFPSYAISTISPDDRYIYTSIRMVEADIWLLTLDEES
jgi:Tol biopolymer transport system component